MIFAWGCYVSMGVCLRFIGKLEDVCCSQCGVVAVSLLSLSSWLCLCRGRKRRIEEPYARTNKVVYNLSLALWSLRASAAVQSRKQIKIKTRQTKQALLLAHAVSQTSDTTLLTTHSHQPLSHTHKRN